MIIEDLSGQQFGRLTVIEQVGRNKNGDMMYRCICNCNNVNEVITSSGHLKTGHTQSCGCLRAANHYRTHGESHGTNKTRLYNIWINMRSRCSNPNETGYENYGGRGITVCEDWNNYENFRDWAYNNGYTDDLTIDRIDVNGNYEPDNCQWATMLEQNNNRRSSLLITYFGETHSLKDWCRIFDLPYDLIHNRYHDRGWDFWSSISTPLPDHYYTDIGIYV
jgi:hypothetical protein